MSEEDLLKSLLGDLWDLGQWQEFGASNFDIDYWHGLWFVNRGGIGDVNVGIDSVAGRIGVWYGSEVRDEHEKDFGEFSLGDPDLGDKLIVAVRACLCTTGVKFEEGGE